MAWPKQQGEYNVHFYGVIRSCHGEGGGGRGGSEVQNCLLDSCCCIQIGAHFLSQLIYYKSCYHFILQWLIQGVASFLIIYGAKLWCVVLCYYCSGLSSLLGDSRVENVERWSGEMLFAPPPQAYQNPISNNVFVPRQCNHRLILLSELVTEQDWYLYTFIETSIVIHHQILYIWSVISVLTLSFNSFKCIQ